MIPALEAVTAVIPTKDRMTYLRRCLRAVLGQEGVDLEVLVVDDGSSDGTSAYVESLADDRVRVLRNDRSLGLAAARNRGIDEARTRWIAFCDDDDLWAPTKLRRQLDALRAAPGSRWACAGSVSVRPDLEIVGHQRAPESGDVRVALSRSCVIPGGGSGVLVERELLRQVGGFDPTWPRCEDYECWLRIAKESSLAAVDEPLLAYQVTPGSLSHDIGAMGESLAAVTARARAEVGVEDPADGDVLNEQYLGRFLIQQRRRAATLRHYSRLAVRHRLPGQLAYAVGGALAPGLVERRCARKEREEVPPDWVASAQRWLAPLRAA